MMVLRSGGASSSAMQGMPCNSRTVRSRVTLNRSRTKRASVCFSASGVVMPSSVSRRANRPAMPQMSVSGKRASSASIAASSSITQTPAHAGSFLARWFATLASVLVAAMPTDTGMPVHCSTRCRSARPCASSRVSTSIPTTSAMDERAHRCGVRALALRVARLEGAATGLAPSYVVRVPAEAMGDADAKRAAIAEHRRCTGWTGPVVLAPARMTQSEWVARDWAGGCPMIGIERRLAKLEAASIPTARMPTLFVNFRRPGGADPPAATATVNGRVWPPEPSTIESKNTEFAGEAVELGDEAGGVGLSKRFQNPGVGRATSREPQAILATCSDWGKPY